MQFITNRAWLQKLSNSTSPLLHNHIFQTVIPSCPATLLISQEHYSIFTLCTLGTFLAVLPAQQMSIRSNLDTSTVCLQQADATVLSRRGSYFYFSMRAVKASQNKQTQAKLLLFFFFFSLLSAPCSLGEQHCSHSQQGALMGRCSAKGQLPSDGPHMFL